MAKTHSGGGKGTNNNHDPTLKEHEAAKGHSGEAITGEQKKGGTPDRKPSRSTRG